MLGESGNILGVLCGSTWRIVKNGFETSAAGELHAGLALLEYKVLLQLDMH